jgi:organic radical activating enzyme
MISNYTTLFRKVNAKGKKMLRTKIQWDLHDYCTRGCSYCPGDQSGGSEPNEIGKYLEVTNTIMSHYKNLGRAIDWTFSGGEPLEIFDFPEMLKLCKTDECTIELITNGGKLWMDWWALEPYIDKVHLTYHDWQNPNLIRFIIQTYQKKNKPINVMVPIRPEFFEQDVERALTLETDYNIVVSKTTLYKHGRLEAGPMFYTNSQLRYLKGDTVVETRHRYREMTYEEQLKEIYQSHPSFTHQKCNAGIEYLHIGHTGWIKGSECGNQSMGNIWNGSMALSSVPQVCGMQSCIYWTDRQITKFK